MTPKDALELLENRLSKLAINYKIGSRDIANFEIKEIVTGIQTHVIPTIEALVVEHEELKRDIARYFELAPNIAKRLYETQPDEEVNFDDLDALHAVKNGVFPYTGVYKEYIELKEKLSKAGILE